MSKSPEATELSPAHEAVLEVADPTPNFLVRGYRKTRAVVTQHPKTTVAVVAGVALVAVASAFGPKDKDEVVNYEAERELAESGKAEETDIVA